MFNKNKKTEGIMNVIRCDETEYLIWKWRPQNYALGESSRENAIRWGSSLRIKDGSVAVFVYKNDGNTYQEFIEGPFDDILRTKNLPIISNIVGLVYGGESPFQAEIYFINMAKIIQMRFAVPFFDIFDPRYIDFSVPVAIRGTITYRISNYKEFIRLHRLDSFDMEMFNSQIKDVISRYVKSAVINLPIQKNISVIQLESQIDTINEVLEESVSNRLNRDFGVLVSGVDIAAIEIDKTSENYAQLKAITQDITLATIQTKAQIELKNLSEKQQIELHDYEERLKIQREENAYSMHKHTQTENINAFDMEKKAEVGIAGAEAIGKMGGMSVPMSESGNQGLNMASIMTSMSIGGAIGRNLAGTFNDIMTSNSNNSNCPPPIPKTLYNVVIENKSSGPFSIEEMEGMAQKGMITAGTLVWKPGMTEWKSIEIISELSRVLNAIPPEI
ncbi:MAG: SPFH domain-containing protein [Lachnospiraceae bacterium]|nr:SPFH domain-containing protein [Lachnospiraceae bacterium]